jgi:hypothetical protein
MTMATYLAMAIPKPGFTPDLSTRPLAPRDITAGSDREALENADSLIAAEVGEFGESIRETRGDEAAAAFHAWAEQWQPWAQRVDRPAVDVEPRKRTEEITRDGEVVGWHYHYSDETGAQSFDVLLDCAVHGLLVGYRDAPAFGGENIVSLDQTERKQPTRRWVLAVADGALAPLADRRWEGSLGGGISVDWPPDQALADIRAALEAGNDQHGA